MDYSTDTKPDPIDLSHHLTAITRNREASNIKRFYKYFLIPNIQNIAGGTPNHHHFPYDTLGARVALTDRFKPTPNHTEGSVVDDGPGSLRRGPDHSTITVPQESEITDRFREIDIKTALQYGTSQGYPPLFTMLRQFTRENLQPNVPYKDGPEILLTCGNTDGMAKTIEALATPWLEGKDSVADREGLLCEEYAYGLALQAVKPRGLNIAPVRIDSEGMTATGPGGLADVLENWDFSQGKRPHLMYTVTIGQNPTTGTLSVSRRREIYALCVKYDVIIIEDDPYWYLQYPSAYKHEQAKPGSLLADDGVPGARNYNSPKSSGYAFLDSLVPSYLSMDYQGRVVRLDTFSKTVAPGCRLGWITAQPALIERLQRITESTTQQPSGFVQSLVCQLILGSEGKLSTSETAEAQSTQSTKPDYPRNPPWKMDGWIRWLEGLRGQYERRMNSMCNILEDGQWLVKSGRRLSLDAASSDPADDDASWAVVARTQIYSFQWPRGGMFVWMRVHVETHPLASKVPAPKLIDALWVFLTTKPYRVLVSPGDFFGATPEIAEQKAFRYFRLCFAAVDLEDVDKATKKFIKGVRIFWMKKDLDDIETLLDSKGAGVNDTTQDDGMPFLSLVGGC